MCPSARGLHITVALPRVTFHHVLSPLCRRYPQVLHPRRAGRLGLCSQRLCPVSWLDCCRHCVFHACMLFVANPPRPFCLPVSRLLPG